MTVIWTILKIIGILLLAVLGLLLAVVLALLFVPVRYRVRGSFQESLQAAGQVTWLLHLLTVRAAFDGTFSCTVRAAGILLYPKPEKKARKKKESGPPAAKGADFAAEDTGTLPAFGDNDKTAEDIGNTAADVPIQETVSDTKGIPDGQTGQPIKDRPGKNPFRVLWERLKSLYMRIRNSFQELFKKWKAVRENVTYYKELLEREDSRRAIRLAWNQLLKILRHVLPRKMDVCAVVGTGDPALTGQIMALQGIVYPWLLNKIRIIPDFEEKHLEGEFYLKGHVTACMLAVCALRVVINKEVRQLIKLLRKKEEA